MTPHPTIDREKVLAVLLKRFPAAAPNDVAAAANAIVGLEPEYDLVPAGALARFDVVCAGRDLSVRHVASGEVRVYCRRRRPA